VTKPIAIFCRVDYSDRHAHKQQAEGRSNPSVGWRRDIWLRFGMLLGGLHYVQIRIDLVNLIGIKKAVNSLLKSNASVVNTCIYMQHDLLPIRSSISFPQTSAKGSFTASDRALFA
jgi:hypothetical protein